MTDQTFGPRPHQQKAIDAVATAFAANEDRATVTMMCGTGKTLTGQRLVDRLIADGQLPATGTVLMLFPSLSLIAQTYESWRKQQRTEFRALAFCSETQTKPKKATDEMSAETLGQVMPNTTVPEDLAKWRTAEAAGDTLNVVFGTYHSSPQIQVMHETFDTDPWDLIVFDEAHNTTGRLDGPFGTALHQQQVPAARRVFMTATPKVHTKHGRKVTRPGDLGIASMSDAAIYGRRVFGYSLPEAVADGILTDYEVVVLAVSEPEVLDYIDQVGLFDTSTATKAENARTEAIATIALFRAARDYDLRRLLTFHSTVAKAEAYAAHLPTAVQLLTEAETLPAGTDPDSVEFLTVSGADGPDHRQHVKDALGATDETGFTVLSNCKVFGEGVDIPTLDGLLMADERRSPTEVTQIVGRIIRHNDKRVGKSVLVLPVVVTPGEDAQTMLAHGSFRKVWDTLLALAEHDSDMAADLEKATRRKGENEGGHPPRPPRGPEDEEGPTDGGSGENGIDPTDGDDQDQDEPVKDLSKITFIDTDGTRDPADILRAFETTVVDRVVGSWEQRLEEFKAVCARLGWLPRRSATDGDEKRAAEWLRSQRQSFRKGVLSPERIDALDDWSAESGIEWRSTTITWEQGFGRFKAVCARLGRPPKQTAPTEDEKRAAGWLYNQRQHLRTGVLSPERERQLDDWSAETGIEWRSTTITWEQGFEHFKAVCARLDRLPKQAVDVDEKRAAGWLSTQRHRLNKGTLRPEREARLNAWSAETGIEWRSVRSQQRAA